MAVTYYALLTTIGAGKLANATALGTTLKITQLAVGDGGGNVPTPDASRTQLVNEVRRAPLNRLSIDPANSAQIIAEQVIPEDVGGWWIREMGLYDEAGALIAYANCAPSYKPQLAEGSGRTQTVRIVLIVSNAASVELKIDPSVVLATREYVDNSIVTALNRLDYKQSVRAATTASITLSGLQTVDGVALAAGDRVLVKNQASAVDNGLYVVAAGVWKRATDADENSEVTPGLTVTVESGTAQADSVWQLVTDGAIVLGTTSLAFQNITNGLAKLASPAFSGSPTAPNPVQGDLSSRLATTSYVRNLVAGSMSKSVAGGDDVTLTADEAGYGMLTFTGALTANISVIVPSVYRQWVVHNRTSGPFTLTLKTLTGSGVPVTQGRQRMLVCNTVDVYSPELDFVNTPLQGSPTAPTAPLFDATTRVASTEFVQRAVGNFANTRSIQAATLLSSADCGLAIGLGGGVEYTVTLPNPADVVPGATIAMHCRATVPITVASKSGNQISPEGNLLGSIKLLNGESVLFVREGGIWAVHGVAALKYSVGMSAFQGSNGYQRLPSGLIIQWGANSTAIGAASGNFSFSAPFPSACLQIVATDSGNSCIPVGVSAISNSQFILYRAGKVYTNTGDLVVPGTVAFRWFAIGF
ncbi:phage tail protein [Pseudomonas denitrificans (nom. rej.)]|uniref:phage tail protein n=1 Tax=Pseudomonas denitrificans TaxID=43306 RepID=UPI001E290A15|nr:phage tail protein [Pseudomonas denitrificans (nom. rej.)]